MVMCEKIFMFINAFKGHIFLEYVNYGNYILSYTVKLDLTVISTYNTNSNAFYITLFDI